MKYKRIAIDISKHVFTLHGVDEQERNHRHEEENGPDVEDAPQEEGGHGGRLHPGQAQPPWPRRPGAAAHSRRVPAGPGGAAPRVCMPPSMAKIAPLTYSASSDAR